MRIMMICYVLGYILLLHQTTTVFAIGPAYTSWVISFFYIKPQQRPAYAFAKAGWVISFFYIKPQRKFSFKIPLLSWVISFFYIKPQRFGTLHKRDSVGLYPSSTSNHNPSVVLIEKNGVGLYPSSTSNHNYNGTQARFFELGYILLLHQTTTVFNKLALFISWVISFFYIKPQRTGVRRRRNGGWVISFFYIKPQRKFAPLRNLRVGLYPSSTSNHNRSSDARLQRAVGLYPSSTSNHNASRYAEYKYKLGYILLLHQTTTATRLRSVRKSLGYILLLHQTTTETTGEYCQRWLGYILLLHQTTTYMR